MAFHLSPIKGHTKPVIGYIYSRYQNTSLYATHCKYKLHTYNPATGLCKMSSLFSNGYLWISVEELSTWYLLHVNEDYISKNK